MRTSKSLYPNTGRFNTLEIAPRGSTYLFEVTRQGSQTVKFVLTDWGAADLTVAFLRREGYAVEVVSLAYEPDEDFLNELLAGI